MKNHLSKALSDKPSDIMQVKNIFHDFVIYNKDFNLAMIHANFTHNSACKFVFFIGAAEAFSQIESLGFSLPFISKCYLAREQGFEYICFYQEG